MLEKRQSRRKTLLSDFQVLQVKLAQIKMLFSSLPNSFYQFCLCLRVLCFDNVLYRPNRYAFLARLGLDSTFAS